MTKKEFKRAMQCGLGRCIQELNTTGDIEKYRGIVLWGCTHNLAFDAQCEGTRSYYLYRMVQSYPDHDDFVSLIKELPITYGEDIAWLWEKKRVCKNQEVCREHE